MQRALHGPVAAGNESIRDLNLRERIAIAPVILAIVALGFYPKPALDVINPVAEVTIAKAGFTDPAPTAGEMGTGK